MFTTINVLMNSPNARMPTYAKPGDIGADLYAAEDQLIPAHSRVLVDTGLVTEPTENLDEAQGAFYLRIAPRSGLAVKGIDIGAGVVDMSYRGNIKVLVVNNSKVPYKVNTGDKIAQMIIEKAYIGVFNIVKEVGQTSRGTGGWGSTGV